MTTNAKNILADIIVPSLSEMGTRLGPVHDLIIKKAKEGFFEEHQAHGKLKELAAEILKLSR
jgi:hypothetical protein